MPVSLRIQNFKCRSLDVDRQDLSWTVLDTQEDVHDYTFQVFRSESPEGPFDKISDEFEDRYFFVDARVPIRDKFATLFYRLRVKKKSTAETVDVGPVARAADADVFAQYIRRAELTLLTQVIGRQVWFFPRRTFGQRCPSCWDFTLGQQKRAGCLDCFDTGYLRGYLDPIEIWMQIDPSGRNVQLQGPQKDQQNQAGARTSFYPPIKPGDVIVELENKRWRVISTSTSQRLRAPIKQELNIREIQRTDIEFKMPINLQNALQDVQASPSRMFSNPRNLDNLIAERLPNAFALYETYPK